MTAEQKQQIAVLREQGNGYKKTAQILGISENTVKSIYQRCKAAESAAEDTCLCCGKALTQTPGCKKKKFCSDSCRMKWWNGHLDRVKRKANYDFICPNCHKPFTAYGNANRKYCCHECYIEDRFGGGRHD